MQLRLICAFFIVCVWCVSCNHTVTPEKNVFLQEFTDGAYHPIAFFVGYTLLELPFDFLSTLFFSCIMYWSVGFQKSAEKFFYFLFTCFLLQFAGESLGGMIVTGVEDKRVTVVLAQLLQVSMALLAGFFRSATGFPTVFKIIDYANVLRQGGAIMLANEFDGLTFTCTEEQKLPDGSCRTRTGEQAMDNLGVHIEDVPMYFGILVLLSVLFRVIFYFVFRYTLPKTKTLKPAKAPSSNLASSGSPV